MPVSVKVGGTWKEITPSVKVSGSWRNVQDGFVKVAGTWRKFYNGPFFGTTNWLIGSNSGSLFASQDGLDFRTVSQSVLGANNVNDVSFLNNEFWVAGNNAIVARSTNGTTWTTVNIGGTNNYSSLGFGNGIYYAGGA